MRENEQIRLRNVNKPKRKQKQKSGKIRGSLAVIAGTLICQDELQRRREKRGLIHVAARDVRVEGKVVKIREADAPA